MHNRTKLHNTQQQVMIRSDIAHGESTLMLMSTFKCWLTSSLYETLLWIGKGSQMSMALHDILDGFGFDFIQISQHIHVMCDWTNHVPTPKLFRV